MSGKSKKYWSEQFEKFSKPSSKQSEKNGFTLELRQFIASVKLLQEYSATDYKPYAGFSGGGFCSRFWSGRWATHHGPAVRATLGTLYGPKKRDQSVQELIATLEDHLHGHVLQQDGDLRKILDVIEEKTGVKSFKLWSKNRR